MRSTLLLPKKFIVVALVLVSVRADAQPRRIFPRHRPLPNIPGIVHPAGSNIGGGGRSGGGGVDEISSRVSLSIGVKAAVAHYAAQLRRRARGRTVVVEKSGLAALLAAESSRVLMIVIRRGKRRVRARLSALTWTPRRSSRARPQTYLRHTPAVKNKPGIPIVLAPGSRVRGSSRSSERSTVQTLVPSAADQVRRHYEGQMRKVGYKPRALGHKGRVIIAGIKGQDVLMIVVSPSADPGVSYARISRYHPREHVARRSPSRRKGGMVSIAPGWTVGKKLPKGFPLTLPGGSQVFQAEKGPLPGGRVRYRIVTQIVFVVTTSFGENRVDQRAHYKDQLERIGMRVRVTQGGALVGKGRKGRCEIVIPPKGKTDIDCVMRR